MLSPGSKGWISKYFDLVDKGTLWIRVEDYSGLSSLKQIHLTLKRSGLVFGHPTRAIFGHKLDASKWTQNEKLKVLLFEALLFVHLRTGGELNKDAFVNRLMAFYGTHHNGSSLSKALSFLMKASPEEQLEKLLTKRLDIKLNLLENKFWVNSLSNTFVYLDVILFYDFITSESEDAINQYSDFAQNALTAITLSAYADGEINHQEKDIFNVFLASANLSDEQRDLARDKFKKGASLDDLDAFVHHHWLLKRFLLDISTMTVFSNMETDNAEYRFIDQLRKYLDISEEDADQAMMFVEKFIVQNGKDTDFLRNGPSYEKAYDNFSGRWKKILGRNKDKLSTELKESKELVVLMKKSMSEELSSEEKAKVKDQLKDILKSMPTVAIFMIPGGSILLPMMLKIIPDLLPSAFQENKIED